MTGEHPLAPLGRRALIAAIVGIHIAAMVAPADVLDPVDPWQVGRALWHGKLPYRDFAFEYPPGAALAFLLPGAVPHGLAKSVLAAQALVVEVVVAAVVLRRHAGALWRWAPLSLLLFPFLAGGFDALPMAAIACATALIASGRSAGWWVAAAGTLVKLSPGTAWVWGRRPLGTAVAAAAVTVPLLLLPAVVAEHPDDSYIGYSLHRGVQVESVAATSVWLGRKLTGGSSHFQYRFKSFQIDGAGAAAAFWAVAGLIGVVVLATRARSADPWLASFVAVVLFLIASKVLSPQFVAWPAPLAAVLGGRWWQAWLVVVGLTVLAYLGSGPDWILAVAVVRNAVLVGIGVAGVGAMLRSSPPAGA